MPLYSIVILPPETLIQQIAAMKQQLKSKIGFYHSCNSVAHITLNVFMGYEETLLRWERYISNFVRNRTNIPLCFNKTGHFVNGAFFLAPDEGSKAELLRIMKSFYAGFPAPAFGKSNAPHISIGRQLDQNQLTVAKNLISDVSLSFVCDSLVIRKFNEARQQYDVYKTFPFCGQSLFD